MKVHFFLAEAKVVIDRFLVYSCQARGVSSVSMGKEHSASSVLSNAQSGTYL